MQSALLHFESAAFGTNPGEDFGWWVPVPLEPHAVYVACAIHNLTEEPA